MVAERCWANASPREGGARPWATTALISPCKQQIAWRDVKCRFRKVRQPGGGGGGGCCAHGFVYNGRVSCGSCVESQSSVYQVDTIMIATYLLGTGF